ncbi:MAG: hypothetical protein ACR2P3_03665, partial [Geminicoccaceae bacterium]
IAERKRWGMTLWAPSEPMNAEHALTLCAETRARLKCQRQSTKPASTRACIHYVTDMIYSAECRSPNSNLSPKDAAAIACRAVDEWQKLGRAPDVESKTCDV